MKVFKKPDGFPEKFVNLCPVAEIYLQVKQQHRAEEQHSTEAEVERRRRLEPEVFPMILQ
jgi:hypothetical protein